MVGSGAVVLGEPLAKRRVSATGPVREDHGGVAGKRLGGAAGDQTAVEGLGCGCTAGEGDDVRHAGECSPASTPVAVATEVDAAVV